LLYEQKYTTEAVMLQEQFLRDVMPAQGFKPGHTKKIINAEHLNYYQNLETQITIIGKDFILTDS
jgi:hypothetical protein